MESPVSVRDIGRRIKAFRIGHGLTPEELAAAVGVSRSAIYRYEAGQAPKIEILERMADRFGVSLPNLLGVGVEYIASSVSFFERLRQIEDDADQIRVLFGPVSYLLTTDQYDEVLPSMLVESIPEDVPDREQALGDVETLLGILHERKDHYRRRRPALLSLVSAAELQQMLRLGLVGSHHPAGANIPDRRAAAEAEVRNIVNLTRRPPIGVQVGVIIDSMPGTSFQIGRRTSEPRGDDDGRSRVAVSPFRLGVFSNIRLGVATITTAPDAVSLYESMTDELWARSLKGDQAADYLEAAILSGRD